MKKPITLSLFASLLLASFVSVNAQETASALPVKASVNDSSAASAPERQLTDIYRVGVDDDTTRAIGDLPRGRGILGALIHSRETLRLTDLSQDPRSVGFPPGHPPMARFLGTPISVRGTTFGNLYLTEKQEGDAFTEEDEEVVRLLAAQAAVAIENARLYES